ncbi:MAG TPA: DUF4159 domain-containing protein [Terriglobia bacterium]|nr:DUF4159 domain-containing protein [Terriglobia bacterium]
MKRFVMVVLLVGLCVVPAIPDWPETQPEFIFARLAVSNRDWEHHWPRYVLEDRPPWKHDYPESDELIEALLHELTSVRVAKDSYKIVRLDKEEIFEYPFLYLSEPGFLQLTDKEVANLGEYIRRGGFIMADDFRTAEFLDGPEELDVLRDYLAQAVPERKLERLDLSHPIFHSFYDIKTLDMSAPYGEWKPQFWGMSDEHGRLQLIAYYNNDIGDYWKYLDEGQAPLKDSTASIRIGVNAIVYAMTH